jgi:hypothetical protein
MLCWLVKSYQHWAEALVAIYQLTQCNTPEDLSSVSLFRLWDSKSTVLNLLALWQKFKMPSLIDTAIKMSPSVTCNDILTGITNICAQWGWGICFDNSACYIITGENRMTQYSDYAMGQMTGEWTFKPWCEMGFFFHHVQTSLGSYSVPIKMVARAPSMDVDRAETDNSPPFSAKG